MKALKKWWYRNWTLGQCLRKCEKGYTAVIENGYLVGFEREKEWC